MNSVLLRVALFTVVCFFISTISVFAAGVDDNTMAIWLFDEVKGDEISDLSGRGHELEITGNYDWVAGKFGNALHFDIDAFIEQESHEDFSFEDGMTMELWLNLTAITPTVVGIPRKENEYVLAAYVQGEGFYMGPYLNNGGWVGPANSEVTVPFGEWHHHAITYEDDELTVYTDGVVTATMPIPGPMQQTDAPFRISNSCCGGRFFEGAIDEMRISNVARTEEEINEVMTLGLEAILAVDPSDGLLTMWGRIKSGF